ncbi:hypothetical protein ACHMXD_02790 [Micrococcus luteus]
MVARFELGEDITISKLERLAEALGLEVCLGRFPTAHPVRGHEPQQKLRPGSSVRAAGAA